MKIVVCDTGPILHLRQADHFEILRAIGSLHIPPGVDAELDRLDSRWTDEKPAWIETVPLDATHFEEAQRWLHAGLLDAGEAQALALASQIGADWILTDDAAARTVAHHQGFEVHGSLGIILWAAVTGAFGKAEAGRAFDALARSSLWVSNRVLSEAKSALGKIFTEPD